MEYTNDKLISIKDKLQTTLKYADYLEEMAYHECLEELEKGGKSLRDATLKKRERMRDCLNLWKWDVYHKNKLMDLIKLNRCKDRYCPNCRSVELAASIAEFAPKFLEMRRKGFTPYLLTLTQPNCSDDEMRSTLDRMNKAWTKFYRWYSFDDRRGYKERIFRIVSAIRFTEVTRNEKNSNHLHFHALVFLDGREDARDFNKKYEGEWSNKRQCVNMLSNADLQIRELWYKAYNGIKVSQQVEETYKCDIREMTSEKGIYEVFKYCFKDTDIKDFDDFRAVYNAFYKKRIRQGYGELYNLKLEYDGEDLEKEKEGTLEQHLLIDQNETPKKIFTEFQKLFKPDYHEYRKISRFKLGEIMEKIEQYG